MGPRNGTPMRLVSPAPVLVPPGAQRAPQAPQIYPPQQQAGQQTMYSTQNGSSVGGMFHTFINSPNENLDVFSPFRIYL